MTIKKIRAPAHSDDSVAGESRSVRERSRSSRSSVEAHRFEKQVGSRCMNRQILTHGSSEDSVPSEPRHPIRPPELREQLKGHSSGCGPTAEPGLSSIRLTMI